MPFNHHAFGAIGAWLYRYVAGIGLDENNPGGKHIILSPHPDGGLTDAQASHQSLYGEIRSTWSLQEGWLTYSITVPANSMATVRLPKAIKTGVTMENGPLEEATGVSGISQETGGVTLQVGSGSYEFRYKYK